MSKRFLFRPGQSAIVILALMALAGSPSCAENRTDRKADTVKIIRDLEYVPGGDPAQRLDLYLPEAASARPLPLLIWIHGGGWSAGSKAGNYFQYLAAQGYATASLEYRFSQKAIFPAQIQDCQAAIRWLRANSKQYNLDTRNFGVGGDSAGGHLASLVGTSGGKHAFPTIGGNEKQSDRVQAVLDLYGPSDFNLVMSQAAADKTKNIFNFNNGDPYSLLIGVSLGADRQKGEAVSPVHYVSKSSPPFLIFHGDVDALVPYAQSVELNDALHKVGVESLLQTFPGSGHGGGAFGNSHVQKLVKDFFDNHLKHEKIVIKELPESEVR